MLLRDVHYVLPRGGGCRLASVIGFGIDTAELYVQLDWLRDMDWCTGGGGSRFAPPDPCSEQVLPKEVTYDRNGALGTFHLEDECPFPRK